jgi:transcriptional regulator
VNNLEWRRSKVLELSSQGYTQSEIAKTLQVSQPSVNRDLTYLAKQAHENLQTHIQQTLPLEYKRCMNGINQVLKQAWQISQSPEVKKEDRSAALSLANNCYKFIMDLTTNGVVITDAIKYVQGQMDHLNKSEKSLLRDIKQKEGEVRGKEEDIGQQEQKTTNGIF